MFECCVGCEHHKLITHISKTEVFSYCNKYSKDIMEQVKCMSNRERKMIDNDNMIHPSNKVKI